MPRKAAGGSGAANRVRRRHIRYGYYEFTLGVALTEHLAVRGDVTLYSLVESDVHGHELSLGLPLYMRRAYQGPFLEPGFTTVHLENVPVGQVIATPLDG